MIHDGRVIGAPLVPYKDTKANVEALPLTAADAGAEAYATDTGEKGTYSGSAWVWADVKYVHPNHTGDVTSVGDGATTIANKQTLTATAPVTISNSPTVIAAAAPVIAVDPASETAAGVVELATDAEVAAATAGVIPTAPQLPLYRQANGALQAGVDGDARGTASVDLQTVRSAASQVASGLYAALVGGYGNTANGNYSLAHGLLNEASANYSHADGYNAAASLVGEYAHASGAFAARGGAQYRRLIARRAVSAHADTTWYPLFLNGSSALLTIPSNALWNFDIRISGLTNGAAQRWSYDIRGTVVNDGGSVVLIESVVTARAESDAAYEARVVGNDTDDALDIEVRRNGGSAYTIRWVAVVEVVQVIY